MRQENQNDLPFWSDEGVHRPQGTSVVEIEATEEHIGHIFPASFRSLLLEQNGGVSNYMYRVDDLRLTLPGFFPLSQIKESFDSADMFGTPKGVIAIASGAHHWLGLDYRASNNPSVVYQDEEESDNVETIADSFDSFLACLVEED